MPTPVNYIVTIAVDPPDLWPSGTPEGASCGNFVYSPALVRVSPGDTITWTCNHHFALTFKEGTPVDEVELTGTGSGPYSTGPRTVRDVKGQFHYAVAVWDGSRVHLDAACAGASVN